RNEEPKRFIPPPFAEPLRPRPSSSVVFLCAFEDEDEGRGRGRSWLLLVRSHRNREFYFRTKRRDSASNHASPFAARSSQTKSSSEKASCTSNSNATSIQSWSSVSFWAKRRRWTRKPTP